MMEHYRKDSNNNFAYTNLVVSCGLKKYNNYA